MTSPLASWTFLYAVSLASLASASLALASSTAFWAASSAAVLGIEVPSGPFIVFGVAANAASAARVALWAEA